MSQATQGHSPVTDADLAGWEWLGASIATKLAWNPATNHWDWERFEDLRQEARLVILRELPRHDPARGTLRAFLTTCIRCRMLNYLVAESRPNRLPAYRVNGESWPRRSSLITSLDALEQLDRLRSLGDHRPEREAELAAQVAIAVARAELAPTETAALRANLCRRLTKLEENRLARARRKLRQAMMAGSAEETCERERLNRIGRVVSQGTRERLREAANGRTHKCSEATRAKMRASASRRRASQATRDKISAGLLGHEVSNATRQKLRVASTGRTPSPETREKIRRKAIGRKVSDETKCKIRETQLKRFREKARAAAGER